MKTTCGGWWLVEMVNKDNNHLQAETCPKEKGREERIGDRKACVVV